MNKMCIAYLGALLLALHLHLVSSQTDPPQVTAKPDSVTRTSSAMPNRNVTQPTGTGMTTSKDNGAGKTDAFTLLLPLAVGASLLLGWS